MLSGPLPQQETAELATGSPLAANVDLSADQLKTWNSMRLTAAYPEDPRRLREPS